MSTVHTITPNSEFTDLPLLFQKKSTDLESTLHQHGAILFRGFNLPTAESFEQVARLHSPTLSTDYLGTSPRTKVTTTGAVYTASEVPNFFPMMQHCEMSFLKDNPRYIYFYCAKPSPIGGQTPICDFKAVAEQMDPAIKKEFETKNLMTIRSYRKDGARSINPFALKPWADMFGSTDRSVVENVCAKEGLEATWTDSDGLVLTTRNDAFRAHPVTGDRVWHNHAQVFHDYGVLLECRQVFARERSVRAALTLALSVALVFGGRLFRRLKPGPRAMDVRFGDGSKIPDHMIKHVHDLIWKNMTIFDWKQGDLLMLDNRRTSHGRLPYRGPRSILVTWNKGQTA